MNQFSILKSRNKTLKSLKKLVTVNKMIGTTMYQKANAESQYIDEYYKLLESGIYKKIRLMPQESVNQDLFNVVSVGKIMYIVIGSDKGLCGGFNHSILRAMEGVVYDTIHIFGKKIATYFNTDGFLCLNPSIEQLMTFSNAVIKSIDDYSSIILIYNDFQEVVKQELLPILSSKLVNSEEEDNLCEIDEEDNAINDAIVLLIASKLYAALKKTEAIENLQRMISMSQAAKNCNESLVSVTSQLNKIRQQSITQSLLEIISSY